MTKLRHIAIGNLHARAVPDEATCGTGLGVKHVHARRGYDKTWILLIGSRHTGGCFNRRGIGFHTGILNGGNVGAHHAQQFFDANAQIGNAAQNAHASIGCRKRTGGHLTAEAAGIAAARDLSDVIDRPRVAFGVFNRAALEITRKAAGHIGRNRTAVDIRNVDIRVRRNHVPHGVEQVVHGQQPLNGRLVGDIGKTARARDAHEAAGDAVFQMSGDACEVLYMTVGDLGAVCGGDEARRRKARGTSVGIVIARGLHGHTCGYAGNRDAIHLHLEAICHRGQTVELEQMQAKQVEPARGRQISRTHDARKAARVVFGGNVLDA